jgi:predicted Zn-dependent protease
MATTNVGRLLQGRYDEAVSKYDTDQHSEALEELRELLMDAQLSSVLRCLANAALADGVGVVGVHNWFLAESYRSYAEEAYDDLASFPIDLNLGEEQKAELACFRQMLDSLAAELQRNDPRPHQMESVSNQ